jgi:hypothetical protein
MRREQRPSRQHASGERELLVTVAGLLRGSGSTEEREGRQGAAASGSDGRSQAM